MAHTHKSVQFCAKVSRSTCRTTSDGGPAVQASRTAAYTLVGSATFFSVSARRPVWASGFESPEPRLCVSQLWRCRRPVVDRFVLQAPLEEKPSQSSLSARSVDLEQLRLLDGSLVPDVSSYKYLGVPLGEVGYRRVADLKHRIRKSWACIRRLDGIWSSNVSADVKRKLFFALVVPHWTYCDVAWPRLRTTSLAVHRRCNVMLRHCLGPSAAEWHTEELYGGWSFLPIAAQRLRLQRLGHLVREHFEGRRYHRAFKRYSGTPTTRCGRGTKEGSTRISPSPCARRPNAPTAMTSSRKCFTGGTGRVQSKKS